MPTSSPTQRLSIASPSRARRGRSALASAIVVTFASLVASGVVACRRDEATTRTNGLASASAVPSSSVALLAGGLPIPAASIALVVNPDGAAPYAGPVGAVEGVVRVTGDAAPELPEQRVRFGCSEAMSMYRKLFRAAPDGALADTIVGATEYRGYVPAKSDAVEVKIKGCAFDRRAVTMTFGQRLEVRNLDERESYVPHLDGSRNPALMVAIPKGDAVRMYPARLGHFMLVDDMKHDWMETEVFVFRFATHAVTGVDGKYRIEGLPVGPLKVSARHPAIVKTIDKQIEIKAGETARVDFEIAYVAPAASASASSAPAAPTDASAKPTKPLR